MDVFLEDFVLTHIIYLPTNVLCNYLKNYYKRRALVSFLWLFSLTRSRWDQLPFIVAIPPEIEWPIRVLHRRDLFQLPQDSARVPCVSTAVDFEVDVEYSILSRRRVVTFLHIWVNTLGLQYFLDPAANSFVEELYCHVLEDHRRIPGLSGVLHRMAVIRQLREEAMRTLVSWAVMPALAYVVQFLILSSDLQSRNFRPVTRRLSSSAGCPPPTHRPRCPSSRATPATRSSTWGTRRLS